MIDIESYSVEAYLKATGVDRFARAFDDASRSVDDVDKNTKKANTSIKSIVKTIAGVAAAVGVFNTLRKAVDGAISRYDTLNNFPRVMEQMGFSAKQSSRSIDQLSDGIQGLPTTLDDVAGTAQRIAILTDDLDGAVDTTLALNNAFISSGSDAANASRGLEQYVQMLSKGEVDLQSWRTLQETMGVALNDTAKAFGFAGASAQNDLYDALKDGHITFDEFNDKIIELSNETGGFSDRALTASGGIRTAWTNMNTAVVRGVTNIITAIDDALSKTRLESIQNIIETIGTASFSTLDAVSKLIGPAISGMIHLYNVIEPLIPLILGLASAYGSMMIINKISAFVKTHTAILLAAEASQKLLTLSTNAGTIAMATQTGAIKASTLAVGVLTGRISLAQAAQIGFAAATRSTGVALRSLWAVMSANPIITIISILAGLVTMTTYLWKTNETFRGIVMSAWESVQNVVSATVNVFNSAMEKMAPVVKMIGEYFSIASEYIGEFLSFLGTGIVNAFSKSIDWLGSAIEKVGTFFSNLKGTMDIKDVLGSVIGPLTTMATMFLGLASPIGWAVKGFTMLATQTSVFSDLMSVFSGDMSIGKFVNNFASELSNLITNMADSATQMITKGAEMITGFIQGISEKLPEIIRAGVEVITTIIESISESLPMVLGVGVEVISALVDSITQMLPMVIKTWATLFTTLIDTIITILPMLIDVWLEVVNTLIDTIVVMLPMIIDVVIQLIMTIIETVLTMLPILIETYITIIQTLIDTVLTMLPLIIDVVLTLIMTIVEILIENLPLIIDAGIQILTALIDGIITIIPVLIDAILMIITELLSVLIESLPLIIDAGIQILMALIDGIISILPVLIKAGIDLVIALVDTFISLLPQLIDAGIKILLALVDGIVSILPVLISSGINLIVQLVSAILGMIPKLLSAGKDLIIALIEGVLSLLSNLLKAGKDLVTSLISGMTGLLGNLLSTGKDLAKSALDGVKGMAGDFLTAGKNIVGSIADGIKSNVSKVTGAIGNVTSKIRDFLPFSPAKDGALTDIMDIQLVQSIAEAIKKGERYAVQAMAGISDAIYGEMPQVDIAGQVDSSSARINTSIDHEVNRNDSNLENILRQALNRDQVIVLDTGELVGQTADRYNQTFGSNAENAERWGEQ